MAQQPSASSRAPDSSGHSTSEDVVEQVKHTAQQAASEAKRQAEDQLRQQKQEAAGGLSDVADALHVAGAHLKENDHDVFAEYAHAAADQVERFTTSIRNRSVGDMLDDAQRFAYREPGLFIGGAFLLGIFGARFFKASEQGYQGPRVPAYSPYGRAPYGSRRAADYGRPTSGYGRSTPDYGDNVTKHGRPLVTNTPGARMPEPPSETASGSARTSGGTTAGTSGGTTAGATGGASSGTTGGTTAGSPTAGSDSPTRNR